MPAITRLRCQKCGYNNEPERVYCHNCGEKLDRSGLPKTDAKTEHREAKRVQRMVKPRNPWLRRFLKGVLDSMILGFFAALLVLAFLPPRDQPEPVSDEARISPPQLSLVYERSMSLPQPQPLNFSQDQLNAYLASRVRSKPRELIAGLESANERVYTRLLDGRAEVTMHNRVGPVPLYFTTLYEVAGKGKSGREGEALDGDPQAEGGSFKNVGGRIGRLPLHPFLMKNLEPLLFASLAKPLRQEILYLERSASPAILEGQLVLTPQAPKLEK